VTEDFGVGLVTWSPLRSGLLSGKYSSGIPEGSRLSLSEYAWLKDLLSEENLRKTRELAVLASDLGVTLAQLAIGWILRLPRVTSVITGATKVSQLEENLKAVEVPPLLTSEVLGRIEGILANKPGREA
jgi:aryl-alcohol dehydrogenase-like predicted oxidoreductase